MGRYFYNLRVVKAFLILIHPGGIKGKINTFQGNEVSRDKFFLIKKNKTNDRLVLKTKVHNYITDKGLL